MTDLHLLKKRPSILAIDNLDFFIEQKTLPTMTKQMRLHFLLSLAHNSR